MGTIAENGWDFSSFEDFGEWSAELAGIHKSSTLEKHRATLTKLAVIVEDLAGADTEESEPEPVIVVKKGKGKKVIAEVEEEKEEEGEEELYDPPVSPLIR